MTLQEFKSTLQQSSPDSQLSAEAKALWYDGNGDWEKAHDLIQDNGNRESAWIHAYLHRKEGDQFNAQYWYNRAGKKMPNSTLDEEWEQLVSALV